MVKLKSEREIRAMREAGRIVGQTLEKIRAMVRPGLDLLDVERFVHEEFNRVGAKETFLNYTPDTKRFPPYPSNICISVNDQLVHGIPRHRLLKEGDIVTFDLGATYNGYVGDAAISVAVGELPPRAQKLMEVTEGALWAGIRAAGKGRYLEDVCAAIEDSIKPSGFSIVK